MIDHTNAPAPSSSDSPDSHSWFRSRLDDFMRRCDTTVAHILRQEASANLSQDFALPSTDELIGLPPSSRGTNAYAQATRSLKERLVREVRLMEAAIEKGFVSLASTEKALGKSRRDVRDLRAVLMQLPPPAAATTSGNDGGNANINNNSSLLNAQQQQQQRQLCQPLTSITGGPSLSATGSLSSRSAAMFPADIAVSLVDEQNELRQLRTTMQSLQSQLSSARKELLREKTAFKDTCDTAVRCNSIGGPQSLRQ